MADSDRDEDLVVTTLTDADTAAPTSTPPAPTRQLASSVERSLYEIQGEHARGGLGRVLRARDCRLNRTVAIKELLGSSLDAARRFDREAALTARLQHPSIVPVHELGRWEDGRAFYAMKLIDGRPLKELIAELKRSSERLALLPLMLQVVEAIAYAHECGIIHRDLKPSNIVVGKHGEVIVVDWGLAKDLAEPEPSPEDTPYRSSDDSLTQHGAVLGTPAYMPPEQAVGAVADRRSDVYSLGAILFHLLCGVPPFRGSSSDAIIEQVGKQDAPFALLSGTGTAPDLTAIVQKAMARDPSLRYQTAALLAEDLRRFQAGRLVAVHDYSWPLMLRRWIARNRPLVGAIVTSAAIVFVISVLSFTRILHERNVAQSARNDANAKSSELILGRAQGSLTIDPTSSITWLKSYLHAGLAVDVIGARAIAADAESRGVAIRELRGHSNAVLSMVFRDATHLLSTSKDGTLREWDLQTGESQVRRLTASTSGIWKIPGRGFAYLARGGRFAITNETFDREIFLDGSDGAIMDCQVSSEGDVLGVLDNQGVLMVWTLNSAQPVLLLRREAVSSFTLTAGTWPLFYAVNRGATAVYRANLAPIYDDLVYGSPRTDAVRRIFAPSQGEDAILAFSSGTIALLDTPSQTLLVLATSPGGALVAGTSDGRHVVAASKDGIVRYWALHQRAGMDVQVVQQHAKAISSLLMLTSPLRVVASDEEGAIEVSDLESGANLSFKHGEKLFADMAVNTDGSYISSGGSDASAIRIWPARISRGKARTNLDSALFHVAYVGNDHMAASESRNGSVFLWDIDRDVVRELFVRISLSFGLAVSRDGTLIANATAEGPVHLWSLPEGGRVDLISGKERTLDMAFSDDSQVLATASSTGVVHIWNRSGVELCRWQLAKQPLRAVSFAGRHRKVVALGDGAWIVDAEDKCSRSPLLLESSDHPLLRIAFARDTELFVTGSPSGSVRLWSLKDRSNSEVVKFNKGVKSLAISDDALRIVASSEDGTVVALDRASSRETTVRTLRLGRGVANSVALSPSHQLVGMACQDGLVRVWDLETDGLCVLRGHDGFVADLKFRQDERQLISVGWDGSMRTWDLPLDCPSTNRRQLDNFLQRINRDRYRPVAEMLK